MRLYFGSPVSSKLSSYYSKRKVIFVNIYYCFFLINLCICAKIQQFMLKTSGVVTVRETASSQFESQMHH